VPDEGTESSSLKSEQRSVQEFLGGLFAPPYIPEDLNSDHRAAQGFGKEWDVEGQLLEGIVSLGELDFQAEGR
jgi:hypothetical protein